MSDLFKTLSDLNALKKQIENMVPDVISETKGKIKELNKVLQDLANEYPNNATVRSELKEFLPISNPPRVRYAKLIATTIKRNVGRKRLFPRLELEYNDGEKIQYKNNPNRLVLAKLLKDNPSGSITFENGAENRSLYVSHSASELQFRLKNFLPFNTSGLKSLTVI